MATTFSNAAAGATDTLPAPAAITAADFFMTTVNGPTISRAVNAPGTKSIPASSPAVPALAPLFDWDATLGGDQALTGAQWGQILLAAASYDPAAAVPMRGFNLAEHDLDDPTSSGLLAALARGHLFSEPIVDFEMLDEKLRLARAILAKADELDTMLFTPTGVIRVSFFSQPGQPYVPAIPAVYARGARGGSRGRLITPHQPAVPAVPDQPGPEDLAFIQLCSWASLFSLEDELPGKRLAILRRYLDGIFDDAERRNDGSDVRLAAADLLAGTQALQPSGSTTLSPARAAKMLPQLLDQMLLFPPEFVATGVDKATIAQDLSDRAAYCVGRPEVKSRIERSRIGYATARLYDATDELLALAPNPAGRLRIYDSACATLLSSADASRLPSVALPLLEAKLGTAGGLRDVTRSAVEAGKSVPQILDMFRVEKERSDKSEAVGGTGDKDSDSGYLGNIGSFEKGALNRAFRDPVFVDLCNRESEFDFSTSAGQREVLAEGFQSAMVVVRLFVTRSTKLRAEHPFLGQLWRALVEMLPYFSDAQAYDKSTGGRKVGAEEYRWLEAAMKAVCAGKFNRDWVNAISGGALALANSISAVPFAPVIDSEIYTVDASLELAQSFVHNTMVALSYPRESCDAGACWWDVFQFQRDFIKYSHTVGGNTGSELRTFGDEQFREMLDYAGTLYLNEITAVEVKDAALLYALPYGAPYFTNLRKRMDVAEPLRQIQKAFPKSFGSSSTPTLPGTTAPSVKPAGTPNAGGSGGDGGSGKGGGSDAAGKGGGQGPTRRPVAPSAAFQP